MYTPARRFGVTLLLLPLFWLSTMRSSAQSAQAVAASARITAEVNATQITRLQGHVPAWATAANDQGALGLNRQLTNMHLILARAPQVEAAFQQLLADQQDPSSPRYHQWLTPEQSAAQFGIASADLQAVTDWLQSQGLTVNSTAAGGVFITFSGPVMAVQNAFATELHNFNHSGTSQYAPTAEPAIPSAIANVVYSVAGLSENLRYVHSHTRPVSSAYAASVGGSSIRPLTTYGNGAHYLSPADFNTIYDISSVVNTGVTGTGYRVGVIIDSTVSSSDLTAYETLFGLPSNQPVTTLVPNNTSPTASTEEEGEADLDVQRVIGTAPGTGVDLLLINSLTDSNIFSGLEYAITENNDAAVNMSFGGCNTGSTGKTEASQYDAYYETLASQGISVFVSSGDSGVAGCGDDSLTSKQVAANILCMSSYATCVGGTEFNDTASNWSSTNDATTKASALGYIAEGGWNEPTYTNSQNQTVYQAAASGGGPGLLSKPTWQTGTGVPSDGLRDTPDIAFTASDHNGFLICQSDEGNTCNSLTGFSYIVGGTSAASPSMAAITALLDQKLGARQGSLNATLYQLAVTSPSAFHDVTVASSGVSNCAVSTPSMCNNSLPASTSLTGGLAGFLVGTNYDEVTGLGSLDVSNFLSAANLSATNTAATVVLTSSLSSIVLTGGATSGNTATITAASRNGFAGTVTLACTVTSTSGSSVSTPPTCTVSPPSLTLASGTTASTTISIATTAAVTTCTASMTPAPSMGSTRGIAFAALLLVLLPFSKRKAVRSLFAMGLFFVGMAWLTGCAGGTTASATSASGSTSGACTTTQTGGTTTGTYNVVVTAQNGTGTTAQTSLLLTVK